MADYPLDGIRVVELSERGGAAYAGKLLRRLGAEVVKLESPEGDPLRSRGSPRHAAHGTTTTAAFDFFNEGKTTTVVADLNDLSGLVDGSDVFLLDLEPKRYGAWGLVPDELGLLGSSVVCSITPFGLSGPYRDFSGPEFVTTAVGGMNVGIGEPERAPLKIPFMQTALQAGLVASIAVMGALMGDKAKESTVVEISETDVWATIHAGTTMVAFLFSNRLRIRSGRRVLGQPYPHQLFQCKDGWIAVQASERRQFDEFIEMVGSPAWSKDQRFGNRMEMNTDHADEIDGLLSEWFLARTREEIFRESRRLKIPAAPVRRLDEVLEDEDLIARGSFESYTGATGVEITVPAPPFRYRHAELQPPGPVPNLGGT